MAIALALVSTACTNSNTKPTIPNTRPMPWLILLATSSASEYPCAINGLLTILNSGKTKDDYSSPVYAN
ncbi:Uncharacterised protein [Enterobacter cloacae]|nr:Uncharacterised protein [Enterobacter cloacae]